MLLRDVGSCCAKFETGQNVEPTTPNIYFVPSSPKRSATMLDPVCTALPTLLGPHTRITHVGPIVVGSHCIRLHTTANTDASTPNFVSVFT